MTRYMILAVLALGATACGEPRKDYQSAARCQELGYKPGTAEYDQCVRDERANRMLKQQREEFERMRQEERDWKMRRY